MEKCFDEWNKIKKKLHAQRKHLYFHEGNIWWVHLGANIGYETDGKHAGFSRPVVVPKKYNQYSFLALPLSSVHKENPYWIAVGEVDDRMACGILSQMRNIDSKRLVNKIGYITQENLLTIKKKASEANLS